MLCRHAACATYILSLSGENVRQQVPQGALFTLAVCILWAQSGISGIHGAPTSPVCQGSMSFYSTCRAPAKGSVYFLLRFP